MLCTRLFAERARDGGGLATAVARLARAALGRLSERSRPVGANALGRVDHELGRRVLAPAGSPRVRRVQRRPARPRLRHRAPRRAVRPLTEGAVTHLPSRPWPARSTGRGRAVHVRTSASRDNGRAVRQRIRPAPRVAAGARRQERLRALGYKAAPVDGRFGPMTGGRSPRSRPATTGARRRSRTADAGAPARAPRVEPAAIPAIPRLLPPTPPASRRLVPRVSVRTRPNRAADPDHCARRPWWWRP
jgi:hypothetical protein